ncbi:hypothetical protein KC19_VG178300 [Ceratodon purpureus]|uniref:Uncharacterized protein n=1 Tax=Ceratodon purpureus TaxID=3225 RepID=A0A8T0HRG9_CERPU|nr:hypothetical protein KC19_VG178300 [Ceratodon purpureus]
MGAVTLGLLPKRKKVKTYHPHSLPEFMTRLMSLVEGNQQSTVGSTYPIGTTSCLPRRTDISNDRTPAIVGCDAFPTAHPHIAGIHINWLDIVKGIEAVANRRPHILQNAFDIRLGTVINIRPQFIDGPCRSIDRGGSPFENKRTLVADLAIAVLGIIHRAMA